MCFLPLIRRLFQIESLKTCMSVCERPRLAPVREDRKNQDGFCPAELCQEDPDILHMIDARKHCLVGTGLETEERKLVSKKLDGLPASPTHAQKPMAINLLQRHRIRFEGKQLNSMSQDSIVKELKLFIKQRGAPKAKAAGLQGPCKGLRGF